MRFRALLDHFGTPFKAYWGDKDRLERVIGKDLAAGFMAFRSRFDPAKRLKELEDILEEYGIKSKIKQY